MKIAVYSHEYYININTLFVSNVTLRAPTLDVLNVPNAKYLAHLAHQTPKNTKYQTF